MALSETTYAVTDTGQLIEQTRFIPVLHMVRMISRVAENLDADARIDFSQGGWVSLKQAMAVRNRLAHPKLAGDLEVGELELDNAVNALYWFLEVVLASMEATQRSAVTFLDDMRLLADELSKGDPAAWKLYRRAETELRQER